MSLEWFDRVSGELQDSLESICDKYDQNGGMSIERGAKHPRIEFYTEGEDIDREYFCTLFFDPHNEEFYMEAFEPDLGQISKVVLTDIEDIVDAVHERFHDYVNGDSVEEDLIDEEYVDEGLYMEEEELRDLDDRGEIQLLEEIDVDWETPEVTAFYQENDVEVTYQFGIVQETGDGVLKRVNRIWTDDDDMIRDETNFIFSKEEASTIIAMIASHMDSLTEMDYQGEV
ncbi:hypothetical protein [Peribacillus glennii]|uniref:Uncharacterized protein n=1 Tax=Peribacillus glennii TaxID=2303991 RepID=A0A372LEP8_9BACI|nr:hypothetical protein [Peribacillus glennii]RFU64717.1 hypothetical protein D0466_01965 [Peribacillus glennii]